MNEKNAKLVAFNMKKFLKKNNQNKHNKHFSKQLLVTVTPQEREL